MLRLYIREECESCERFRFSMQWFLFKLDSLRYVSCICIICSLLTDPISTTYFMLPPSLSLSPFICSVLGNFNTFRPRQSNVLVAQWQQQGLATGRGCDTATLHLLLCKLFIAYILAVSLTLSPSLSYVLYCAIWLHFIQLRRVFMALWRCFAANMQMRYVRYTIHLTHPTILPTPTLCSRRGVAVPAKACQARAGQSQINLYEKCHVSFLFCLSALHAALAVKIFMHLAVRHV